MKMDIPYSQSKRGNRKERSIHLQLGRFLPDSCFSFLPLEKSGRLKLLIFYSQSHSAAAAAAKMFSEGVIYVENAESLEQPKDSPCALRVKLLSINADVETHATIATLYVCPHPRVHSHSPSLPHPPR